MRQRYEWIDLLRGLAVIAMVWVHAANTFLATDEQAKPWFQSLIFYHGVIAPVFFWVAGYMRGVSASKGGTQKPAWPIVKRLLWIWTLGYLLHVPWNALAQGDFSPPVLRILFQSDVLHCLAASGLLLLAVERAVKSNGRRSGIVALLTSLAVLLSDWAATVTSGFMPLDAYLSKEQGSLFPLFPWFAFAGVGFLIGVQGALVWRYAVGGMLLAFGLPWLSPSTTPSFFLERLGWVVMVAYVGWWATAWFQSRGIALSSWLLLAGRQSLVIYVAHLLMIHAVPWWRGQTLDKLIGTTQPLDSVLLIFLGLVGASMLLAWAWEKRTLGVKAGRAS